MHVRKNQFDNTAALSYGLNVSLIHFALFCMIIITYWPDINKAKEFDSLHDTSIDFM
jgi:hypothetical protein